MLLTVLGGILHKYANHRHDIRSMICTRSICNSAAVYLILHTYSFVLHNSCWIKSDDGAIAAFIVPIVAIILV